MRNVNSVLDEIECSTSRCTISDLKGLTTEELLNFTAASFTSITFDDAILQVDPSILYLERKINPTDMIIGANTYDDYTLNGFTPEAYIKMVDGGISQLVVVGSHINKIGMKEVVDAYLIDKYENLSAEALMQFNSDFDYNCPGHNLAETASLMISGNVYNHIFSYLSDFSKDEFSKVLDDGNIATRDVATQAAELLLFWKSTNFFWN